MNSSTHSSKSIRSTRRSIIKLQRDMVLRVLRGYYEGVQETHADRTSAMKILAKYVRVDEPEILAGVYRTYGSKHLQKDISVDHESVKGLLKALGGEAAKASPSTVVDSSLLEQLEREGFFQKTNR